MPRLQGPISPHPPGEVWYTGDNDDRAENEPQGGGYGNTVIIKHTSKDGTDFYSMYAHMDSIGSKFQKLGAKVSAGDIVGKAGDTGSESKGPHLHFEVITPPKGEAPI